LYGVFLQQSGEILRNGRHGCLHLIHRSASGWGLDMDFLVLRTYIHSSTFGTYQYFLPACASHRFFLPPLISSINLNFNFNSISAICDFFRLCYFAHHFLVLTLP
jgi:hypothetical protein